MNIEEVISNSMIIVLKYKNIFKIDNNMYRNINKVLMVYYL